MLAGTPWTLSPGLGSLPRTPGTQGLGYLPGTPGPPLSPGTLSLGLEPLGPGRQAWGLVARPVLGPCHQAFLLAIAWAPWNLVARPAEKLTWAIYFDFVVFSFEAKVDTRTHYEDL